ncbi:zinc finger, CCHC-type containing protein, partial [Tanacetum coccineum]
SNWLERLLAGSITTWEDLTTRFLAQFFPPRRTSKLCNDILMFQQHHGESLSEAWTHFKDLLQKVPHHGIDLWLQNDPRDFDKSVKAITLPQDVPSTSNHRLIELENQVQRLMEAYLAPTQPTQAVSEKLDDAPLCDTTGSPTAQINFTSTNYHTKEELQSKGIKSPSKLLSPKYLSQSSIIEQNKNPSSPKRIHFINSIVILNKENKAGEEGSVEPSKTNYTNRKNANETDKEVKTQKEVEEETEGEIEEEEEDNPKHFDTFPTIKELRLEPRRKPSNPKKNYNFVGRVKGLKVFIRNFTYECDFMVLEDTTSVGNLLLRDDITELP